MFKENHLPLSTPQSLVVLAMVSVVFLPAPQVAAHHHHEPGPSGGDPVVAGCTPVDWVETLGGPFMDDARDVAAYDFGTAARGEVYVTGSFRGLGFNFASFGTSQPNQLSPIYSRAGSEDVFLAKLDDCGNWIWVRTGGGPGSDFGEAVVVDSQRNVIVVGTMDGTTNVDMDYGTMGELQTHPAGFGDPTVFAAKYDPQGVLQWFRVLGAGRVFDADVDSNDDIVLTRTTGVSGALVRLASATGHPTVHQSFAGPDLALTAISVGDQDRLCVVGNFEDSINVGMQSFTPTSPFPSVFVALLDSSGGLLQMHTLSSPNGEVAANAAATRFLDQSQIWPNHFYQWDCLVAGRFSGNLPLGYATLSSNDSTDRDGWVGRYRLGEADPVSALHIGGSGHQEVMDLALRQDGPSQIGYSETGMNQMWITGFFTQQFQAWAAEQIHEDFASWTPSKTSQGGRDAFVIGYDTPVGTWPTAFGGLGDDRGLGIFVQPQSLRVYGVGNLDDEGDFVLPSTSFGIDTNQALQGYVTGLVQP